jgi:nitronate monooxygenase
VPRTEHDDQWAAKIDLLLADPVPLASFTFGIPDSSTIAALRKVGTVVAQTVTSAPEARLAADAGADVLIVQASAAGGHSGTLTPDRIPADVPLPHLLHEIGSAIRLPMIGGGGISSPADVAAALDAGAGAVVVGTALLLSPESGASAAHRAGLADPQRGTVVTRAFTGRPARGLRNRFTDRFSESAPTGYPAVHSLTSPRRKPAAAAADPEVVNLWAGEGYRRATGAPAAETLAALAAV